MKKIFRKIYYWALFKIKNPEKVTIHPRHKGMAIEYAFSVDGRHYYKCKHDYDIRESRFKYLKTYYQEVENKLTSKDIIEFAQATTEYINKGKYVEAGQLMKELEYRSTWLFEPTSLYKYASVMFFDLGETITDYDMAYNHEKIAYWSKKKELLKLLLKDLMLDAGNLLSLSKDDFKHYILELQRKKDEQQKLILASGVTSDSKSIETTI